MCPSAPTPGSLVGGRYRLEQMLVQGGMGNVWKAQHVSLNSPVAIKFISPLIAEDDEALGRFMLEAQSAAALRSSHIVQVFDFGLDDGTPFIAMELLQGESLAERLRRRGVMSALETGRILSHVARGIQYAHTTGIVHRDLKPDNIFITTEGDHEVSKVLDFGIAKAISKVASGFGSAQTRAGTLLGSPYYVSPEQAEGDRDIDHRSDLWALGIITFECLTGKRPFESESLAGLLVKICTQPSPRPSDLAQVPAGFDDWFAKATEKDRARRFQNARDLIDGYAQLLTCSSTNLAEIHWSGNSDRPAGSGDATHDMANAPATATLNSTPHRATVNEGALAVTPSVDRNRNKRRHWQTLLGAALLLILAGGIAKVAGFTVARSATKPLSQDVQTVALPALTAVQAASNPSAAAGSHAQHADAPDVTPVAAGAATIPLPAATSTAPLRATPGSAVRTTAKRAAKESETPTNPPGRAPEVLSGSAPPAASDRDLFRARKLPAETP